MEIKTLVLSGFVGALLGACGSGDSSTPPAETNLCENNNLSIASITGPAITVKMTLKNLPATLPVNMPHTEDNYTEYYWTASFDMDGDEATSVDDLNFELHRFKAPGDKQGTCKISDFSARVFRNTSPNSSREIANMAVEVVGNTIILKVAKSQHEALNNVSYANKVQFHTLGYDVDGQVSELTDGPFGDAFPVEDNVTIYTTITDGGILEDTDTGMSELLGVDVDHIDLQTMEVVID